LLLHLFFSSLGLFLSVLVRKPRQITTLTIALVLILYFIYTISNITPDLSWIGYVSPYKFINLDVLNSGYRLELINIAYFLGFTLLLLGTSRAIYSRKDIYL